MLYETILIPYDNSSCAQEALIEAARFANEDAGVCLRIINIIDTEKLAGEKLAEQDPNEPNPRFTRTDVDELYKTVIAEAQKLVYQNIGTLLDGLENEITIEIVEETLPGEQILTYAKQHNCDLIIMGSRGRGPLGRLLGSVSSHVLGASEIPVMIVR